jgi:phosphate starvation-inducible PhoH-like protein
LNSESTIVLADASALHAICGPHDENLLVMEELLHGPIFLKGNELRIHSSDPRVVRRFSLLVHELERCVDENRQVQAEEIRAAYSTINEESTDHATIRENQLVIPQGFAKVFARTANQVRFLQALQSHAMVFGIGPAGTGKTYLAVAHALAELLSHRKRKLILTRPVVEAGENLGFLPGDLAQKLNPYVKPLYDAMESLVPAEIIARLEEQRAIEIAPLAYMRGRSLKNCYIVLDEAQNTTREQMKMFLTRVGEGSKVVITGDITQIDLPTNKASGLIQASQILADIPDIGFIHFENQDVVRSRLVRRIIEAYDAYQPKPGASS